MPIKFRCQHCRQFLGISRSKAGEVVDCPTCGRTLRVPELDGTVAPVPEPKINVNELAGALDELARIGEEGADEQSEGSLHQPHKPVVVKELAPLPTPEPISVEAPPPAVEVDIHAEKPRPAQAAAIAPVVAAVTPRSAAANFPAVLKSAPVLGTIAATALLAFLLGWMVRGSAPADAESNGDGKTTAATTSKPAPQLRPVFEPQHWKPAVSGQITYQTSGGSNKPDKGARILLLPEKRPGGQAKLPVTGFWTAANEADFRLALAGLRELGGNAARADAEGRFELKLPPSAGLFQIVAISSHSQDDFDSDLPASTRTLLAQYFDRPDALIGRLHFKQSKLKFSGDAVENWNHKFE